MDDGVPTFQLSSGTERELRLYDLALQLDKLEEAARQSEKPTLPLGRRRDRGRHRVAMTVACGFVVNGLPLATSQDGALERCIAIVLRQTGYPAPREHSNTEEYSGPAHIVRDTVKQLKKTLKRHKLTPSSFRRPSS